MTAGHEQHRGVAATLIPALTKVLGMLVHGNRLWDWKFSLRERAMTDPAARPPVSNPRSAGPPAWVISPAAAGMKPPVSRVLCTTGGIATSIALMPRPANPAISRATADRRVMLAVLRTVRARGLWFEENQTTAASVASDVAAQLGMPVVLVTILPAPLHRHDRLCGRKGCAAGQQRSSQQHRPYVFHRFLP